MPPVVDIIIMREDPSVRVFNGTFQASGKPVDVERESCASETFSSRGATVVLYATKRFKNSQFVWVRKDYLESRRRH
jgi:hypothetical protein